MPISGCCSPVLPKGSLGPCALLQECSASKNLDSFAGMTSKRVECKCGCCCQFQCLSVNVCVLACWCMLVACNNTSSAACWFSLYNPGEHDDHPRRCACRLPAQRALHMSDVPCLTPLPVPAADFTTLDHGEGPARCACFLLALRSAARL